MKRYQSRIFLLGVFACLTACATTRLPEEKPSPEARLRRLDVKSSAPQSSTSAATTLPCSMERATPTSDGVRIVFSEKVFWYFDDPKGGDLGMIGVGGVTRFVTRPDGHDDALPAEPHIDLEFGQELRLREHHAVCTVWVTRDQGQSFLHTKSSFCWMEMPCKNEETAHELRG